MARKKSKKPGKPKKRGARSKGTPEALNAVVMMIRKGSSFKDAARILGVNKNTITYWRDTIPGFSDRIRGAQSMSKDKILARIRRYGEMHPKYWNALAWILEKQFPEEFGRRDKVDVTSKGKAVSFPVVMIPAKAGVGSVKDQ